MFTPRKSAVALRAAVLIVCTLVMSACSLTTDNEGPSTMAVISGDAQTAPPNTALAEPLVVVVVNQFGEPLKDITINWAIVSGGGALSGSSSVSDDGGHASVNYTTGPTAGSVIITATVHGLPPLGFDETISAS
jgi:hypothetical protein